MSRCFLLRGVETGALENYINIEFAPRKLSCVGLSVDSDLLAVNDDRIVGCLYSVLAFAELASETTLCGVILKKVSEHLRAGEVVDCNYFITLCFKHLTECETSNTAEAVDSYFCHCNNRF